MKNSKKEGFDKSIYNPYVFAGYKILKYALVIGTIYFAYKGFMAWK